MSRAYRAWSQQEEQVLFDILHSLHDAGSIKGGQLRECGYTDIEKQLKVLVPNTKHTADSIKGKFRQFKGKFQAQVELMDASGMGWNPDKSCCECDPEIFAGWVKSHKLAAGLNNTKLPRWEDLCKILEVNRADGRESMTARDAASRLEGQLGRSKTNFDQYAAETTPMMEDLVNQGYDMHAEGLQDVEDDTATKESTDKGKATSSAGSKRSRNQMTDDYLAGINAQIEIFQESIARTTTNIERLTNNWCLPEDVASRRAFLVEEIGRLPGISYRQGLLVVFAGSGVMKPDLENANHGLTQGISTVSSIWNFHGVPMLLTLCILRPAAPHCRTQPTFRSVVSNTLLRSHSQPCFEIRS